MNMSVTENVLVDDNQLMKRIAGRDRPAFQTLFDRYNAQIYYFLVRYTGRRELAQDLLQETFIRVWNSAHTFRAGSGRCRSWLYTIAVNLSKTELRKKRYHTHTVEVEKTSLVSLQRTDSEAEQNDERKQIREALIRLSPNLREVIVMRFYQQLKFREIAEILRLPEGTVKARYHRAVKQLREIFMGQSDDT